MLEQVGTQIWQLRTMFYGVGPKEMAESLKTGKVPAYTVQAIPYFFLMVAMEFAVSLAKGRPVYRLNDTVISLLQGSVQMIWQYWFKLIGMTAYCYIWDNFRIYEANATSWATWMGCLCLVDCGYYWMHRYAHTYHVLWSAHSVHHSGEDYQFSTALRQGAMQPFFSWIFKLPNALFFHPLIFSHHTALNTLYQFWIHTTFVGHLGPFEYVLNTASHHRMHHRPPGNCNYGGVLIVWDRLFGTFVAEDEQKDYYGLAKQYNTWDPVWANLEHLRRIQSNVDPSLPRTLSYYIGLLFKRRVNHKFVFRPMNLFKPLPAPKRSLWAEPLPNKRVKYDGLASAKLPQVRAYILFLFIASLIFSVLAMVSDSIIHELDAVVIQFVCFSLYISIGRLFDGFEKGQKFNTLRVLAFLCLSSWLITINLTNTTKSLAAKGFEAFSVLDALAWFLVFSNTSSKLEKVE